MSIEGQRNYLPTPGQGERPQLKQGIFSSLMPKDGNGYFYDSYTEAKRQDNFSTLNPSSFTRVRIENGPQQNITPFRSADVWNQYQIDNTLSLQEKFNTARQFIKQTTLEELSLLGNKVDTHVIDSSNILSIQGKLRYLLRGPEQIYRNIDLRFGDRVVWNPQNKTLIVSDGSRIKFYIQFQTEGENFKNMNMSFGEEMNTEKSDDGYFYSVPSNAVENNGNLFYNNVNVRSDTPDVSDTNEYMKGKKLGDWIVRRGPYPGRKNSCGASVGNLLNGFSPILRKILPQSGRDGKNWDSILEGKASQFFKKIYVGTPKNAPAGSILVYNQGAKLGSSARRKHGHVEIKGSDNRYYSYYASSTPGGSARAPMDNDSKYQMLTGFNGYAYVYKG